jgi:hypothetical protein
MSSRLRKLSDRISGAKALRRDNRLKASMAKSLAKLARDGKIELKRPDQRPSVAQPEQNEQSVSPETTDTGSG